MNYKTKAACSKELFLVDPTKVCHRTTLHNSKEYRGRCLVTNCGDYELSWGDHIFCHYYYYYYYYNFT